MPADTDAKAAAVPPAPKKKRRLKRLIIILVILIVLGVVGFAVTRMLMGPAEGTIMNTPPEARSTKPTIEYEQFEGINFTFDYPNTFREQPPNADNPNSVETHTFLASGMMNKLLTISVSSLPSGKLEDDSSYKMRVLHPETYQIKPQTIEGERVMVALNTKDSQQSAFWAHKGKLMTFTVSSVSIDADATAQEYQKMLESVRWR